MIENEPLSQADLDRLSICAAQGDLPSQRLVRKAAFDRMRRGEIDFDIGAYEAMFWSNMAALNGDHTDKFILAVARFYAAQALVDSGRHDEADWQGVEAIVLLDVLVDEDRPDAAASLARLADELPPEIFAAASVRRKEMAQ